MRFAKPLYFKTAFYESIEKEINAIFFRNIYAPALTVLKKSQLQNNSSVVTEALNSGRIFYSDGFFYGKFNGAISKELLSYGAVFDGRLKAYRLPIIDTPPQISSAIALTDLKYKATQHDIITQLDMFQPQNIDTDSIQYSYTDSIHKMEYEFKDALKGIMIPPDFSPYIRENIAKNWTNNLSLYIKDFAEENVTKLRQDIQENAYSGSRAENLVKSLQANYGVSQRKARFLAKQETKLLMTEIHLSKASEVGLNRYKWSTSNDEKVRHSHKVLQGRIINLANPPVVDPLTGRRAHAGCDFGCRCIKIFIID